MKISKIQLLNIDKLYEIVFEKENDSEYGQNYFGSKVNQLYSHMEIGFEVDEINFIEYFFMKLFSSRISSFMRSVLTEKEEIEMLANKYYDKLVTTYGDGSKVSYIEKLYGAFAWTEGSPNNPFTYQNLTPPGFKFGTCFVSFTGSELCSILGINPKQFFIVNSDPEKLLTANKKLKEDYNCNKDDKLKDSIISIFINEFYKFITGYVKNIDLVSEVFCKRFTEVKTNGDFNFYKPTIINLRHPLVTIDYDEDSTDTIVNNLKEYSKLIEEYSIFQGNMKKEFFRDSIVEVKATTSLNEFLLLFELLPKGSINSMDNILGSMKLGRDTNYLCKSLNKLIQSRNPMQEKVLENFIANVTKAYDNGESLLKSVFTIMGYSPFSFTISISFGEIEKIIPSISLYGNAPGTLCVLKFLESIYNTSEKLFSI